MTEAPTKPIAPHYERELARLITMTDRLDDLFATDRIEAYYEARDEVYDHIDRLAATYGPEAAERLAADVEFPWEAA